LLLALRIDLFLAGHRGGDDMAKTNARLEVARKAYREALDAARMSPTPEAWAKLLAAGKELSASAETRSHGRRSRRGTPPATESADIETLE
jgi:hypothetical protein